MSFVFATGGLGQGTYVPRTVEKNLPAGAAYEAGSPVVVTANDEYAEAGVDPAIIAGFSLFACGPDTTGYVRFSRREFPVGKMNVIQAKDTLWHAEYVGALPAVQNGTFGITKSADGKWRVDFAKTGVAARVTLITPTWTQSPLNRGRVFVRVLDANVGVI